MHSIVNMVKISFYVGTIPVSQMVQLVEDRCKIVSVVSQMPLHISLSGSKLAIMLKIMLKIASRASLHASVCVARNAFIRISKMK